ncbi:hypothetical protein [Nonomuraea sp. CA-141351]|uniref:hypothetical protein n=1 Tax=Nonomuraea sp. CA-141351 TaxID=3239996 RepID=UPI003D8B2F63
MGVDVGGGGDETVVRERRDPVAGREWRKHTDRPEVIAPLIKMAIRETGATRVKIDSIGVGFGVIGELRNDKELRGVQIIGVNVRENASKPDKYANQRAEIWWEVGRLLSERRGWDLSSTPRRRSCWSLGGTPIPWGASGWRRRKRSSNAWGGAPITPTRCCWRSTAAGRGDASASSSPATAS